MFTVSHMLQDLRYALRLLLRDRSFTAVAVISLALALAANAVIFSVVDAVLLRPFPYRDQERLVFLWGTKSLDVRRGLSGAEVMNWRAQTQTMENIAPLQLNSFAFSFGQEETDQFQGAYVGTETFSLLGAHPLLGRTFSAAEEEASGEKSVILSYGLWHSRFAGQDMLGKTLRLNGEAYSVIGVMPEEFFYPDQNIQLWVPLTRHTWVFSQVHGLAKLKPGVSVARAQVEFDTLSARSEDASHVVLVGIFPLLRVVVGKYQAALWTLFAAIGGVLLIACFNVANLLLARGVRREKEFAVRATLGAGRGRIFGQLLVENTLIALSGGAAGLLLAHWGLQLLLRAQLTDIPRIHRAALDQRVLLFSLGVSLLSGLLLGLVPAWKASRSNLIDALKQGGATSGHSGRSSLRDLFVILEAAMAMALLVITGLAVNSFVRLSRADWGFQPENAVEVSIDFPKQLQESPELRTEFLERLLDRLKQIPGVEAVGMGYGVPLRWGGWSGTRLAVNGQEVTKDWLAARWVVGRGYFRSLGIPVLKGREFNEQDHAGATFAVVVSAELAEKLWRGEDPIGKQVNLLQMKKMEKDVRDKLRRSFSQSLAKQIWSDPSYWEVGPPLTVVGLVGNVRMFGLEVESFPAMYVDYRQAQAQGLWLFPDGAKLVLRGVQPRKLAEPAKGVIKAEGGDVTIAEIAAMQELVSQSIGGRGSTRLLFLVSTSFGLLALTLAAIGIYGMMAYAVNQRTQEVGVRMTLGAQRSDILRMVLGRGMRLAIFGLALGCAIAWASTRAIASYLFGITPTDPGTFALTSLVLLAVAALSCYLPARRAARLDPVEALRYE